MLLGLQATPNEDSSISSAELLYGAPLVLPGQLPGVSELPLAFFKESTRAAPSHIPARSTSASQEPPEIPHQLQGDPYVYARCGGAKLPLTPTYSGPFAVVSRSLKFFILDQGWASVLFKRTQHSFFFFFFFFCLRSFLLEAPFLHS